ncbi:MAG TPA: glucose-1-phosphate cytidylyltransferase [Bryobacteraceae bacterium]|nr:glucose-1-phosphate cytidylyltransferase [Bryobacteraceae bacterium]
MNIPTVILAGGLGTRLREETEFRPKPMVEIGGKPIIWHIMNTYAAYGYSRFIICLGYKGDSLRDYFLNYRFRSSDFTVTLGTNQIQVHNGHSEHGWRVTMAETGLKTNTAGRLKRIAKYINGDLLMVTYGDGVASVDIPRLLACHRDHGKLATVTAVRPVSRFGELRVRDGLATSFEEKCESADTWVNGGFMVLHRSVLEMVRNDSENLEVDILKPLAEAGELGVFHHSGFWQCMDTLREVELLNRLWDDGNPPWLARPAGRTQEVSLSAMGGR